MISGLNNWGIVEGKGNMERLTNFWGNLKKCVECAKNSNCYSSQSCGHIAEAIAKLRDYEDLEEQGKLLKLSCAVGDMVYTIYSDEDSSFIEEPKVVEESTHIAWKDRSY